MGQVRAANKHFPPMSSTDQTYFNVNFLFSELFFHQFLLVVHILLYLLLHLSFSLSLVLLFLFLLLGSFPFHTDHLAKRVTATFTKRGTKTPQKTNRPRKRRPTNEGPTTSATAAQRRTATPHRSGLSIVLY